MKTIACFMIGFCSLAIATMAIFGQPADPEPGFEVEARGPIHEAFAQPTEYKQEASAPIAKKPPEPIDELPPDQKPDAESVLWIPGYWAWDEDRDNFVWVSGVWRVPVPERRWIPGYWHEAAAGWQWISGYWSPAAETVEVYPAPPEPIEEAVAPAPNADSVYVPGIWVYHETRFRWRPSHWIAMRPGWVWMPARYCWTPAGYCFVDGGWDYELHERGMCFAPIFVDVRLLRANAVYRPRHLIQTDFLIGSLFVHLGRHHYHFGDYYDAGYARRGYVPWVDYRIRRTAYDPLFSYYRWRHRAEPRWELDVRAVFVNRRDNQDSRPPRTLALQEKAPGNKKMMAVASFEQAKTAGVKLAPVSKAQVAEFQKHAVEVRKISSTRGTIETSAKASAPKSPMAAPIKLELPKTNIKVGIGKKAPPPAPDTPKAQDPPQEKTPKDKTPKVDPPKDKTPKVDPPKDKTPKVDPPKDKTPKVDPPKDKTPKVDPPKDKTPKVDPPKDKTPKVDLPKDKTPKVDPPKDKTPKVDPPKDKTPKIDTSSEKSPEVGLSTDMTDDAVFRVYFDGSALDHGGLRSMNTFKDCVDPTWSCLREQLVEGSNV